MKTIYSIGRDPGCDIYLYDDKNLISRNHAVLKVAKGGKYFISDQSMNGTYINGIKMSPGVQVPVTRKDVITFAHVAELDWSQIPDPRLRTIKVSSIVFASLLVLGGAAYAAFNYLDLPKKQHNEFPIQTVVDTTATHNDKQAEFEQQRLEWEKKADQKKQEQKAQKEKEEEAKQLEKEKAEPKEQKENTETKNNQTEEVVPLI